MDNENEEILNAIKQAQSIANQKQQNMALLYTNNKYSIVSLSECEATPLEIIRYVKREGRRLVISKNRISYAG